MTTRLMDGGLRSPEAAERLGIRGRDVYMMLFNGELDGGPSRDGWVYFDEASIDAYLERHGFGVVAGSSTVSSTPRDETADDGGVRDGTPKSPNPSAEARSGTRRHRTNRRSSGS
jgi:hypothetical protein